MKSIILITFFSIISVPFLNAKGSLKTNEAFENYRENKIIHQDGDINPESAFATLLKKRDGPTPSEEALQLLSVIRDNPKKDLIPPLKQLWEYNHKYTFRVTSPEHWVYIRTEDYAKMLCDEIKILIKSMGGNIDDIEPLDEKNTADLNEIQAYLWKIKRGEQDQPISSPEVQSLSNNLISIIKTFEFDASNEDRKLQLFYISGIVHMLGDEKVWPDKKSINSTDSFITFMDEVLSKTLPLIDVNWVQKPVDQNQSDPSAEQMKEALKNSLKSYQQMVLPRLRDQILTNVSNLMEIKKDDPLFGKEIIKRFSKDDACRKVIEDRLK